MSTNEFSNKIRGALFVLLAVFTMASTGWAATYYVDHTGGSDSNAGSELAPWAHCPGLAGWTGLGTITSGDTVYFDNADTWTGNTGDQVLELRPGITYDGSTWGSGTRATLQATAVLTHAVIFIRFSNVTVKGFNVDSNHFNLTGININQPWATQNISNIEINNCIVYNIGQTDNYYYGIRVGSVNGYTTSDVRILNCTVHDTGHEGIALHPYQLAGNIISNITVRNCEVYNTGLLNIDYGDCILVDAMVNGAAIEYNYLHDGNRGIEFYTRAACESSTDIIIRYNIIKNQRTWGIGIFNAGAKIITAEVYGNLFIDNGKSGSIDGGAVVFKSYNYSTSTWKFYNNTFYSIINTATTPSCFKIESGASGTPTIECKNNIFYSDNHIPLEDNKGWVTHNNNMYFRTDSSSGIHARFGASTYNRTTVKTTFEATCQNTDPSFLNTSNLPTGFTGTYGINMGPNSNGLSIESGNALKNGADLGPNFNGAINLSGKSGGLIRPNNLWDIGAYQLVTEEPTAPKPPSGLRIVQ